MLNRGLRRGFAALRSQRRLFSGENSTLENVVVEHGRSQLPTFGESGLKLLDDGTEYPEVITELVQGINSVDCQAFATVPEQRWCNLLLRHFCLKDDLLNAFRSLHAMKVAGVPRNRETYRYLMFACTKYGDTEYALYVMENMIHDDVADFKSFKRLFDMCAADVDRRFWVAYDVIMYFYPNIGRLASAGMRTTGYMSEFLEMLGMKQSARRGRGFITLPNPRGEPYDPFKDMLDDRDFIDAEGNPRKGEALAEAERLRLIPEEFEDYNHIDEIVAKQRNFKEENTSVAISNTSDTQLLLDIVERERELENKHLKMYNAGLEAVREAKTNMHYYK